MPSNSLEQEAMDRVRRMYSSFDSRSSVPTRHAPEEPPKTPERHEAERIPEPVAQPVHEEKPRGMLELLMHDKDQSLILLLLVVLMKDGADMNLLVALIYMLL